ncbi:bifunctional UDP-N-acetylglucosamine diphosphorylase/glucosamine-1-phosphate N-acetyltransferase GlmU [Acetonema longum]|uniref:Bifunctional protein GlmU n=1 Tax=Acetonema longum DSM 6540 TaxID=1009370 RepID=F7NIJ4_9FIRM|nr:bifunctional UDP-N-acetylglucosamine diphosphorylase/glucosamine-1-phosphate N-acetyltransferase GlmU [Acetonema longum]EGO64140.1 bifunctional N-acetylglucosamine-1-phosphate uridyltransferase/glucosamine-1-phosphate acetyltransferase [Acetonema longum DSM 6540]
MADITAVILAAGKGTRMKSALPKVLHTVGGKPMVQHVLDAARGAGANQCIVVIGFGAESVAETIGGQAQFVVQAEQLGTGHAMMQAKPALTGKQGTVMILCGDTPLLSRDTLELLQRVHANSRAAATVLTALMPDPTGYGRVVRDGAGQVVKIVEQKDADAAELAVREVNTAIYCFEQQHLFAALDELTCNNAQGEYYLTDCIAILRAKGLPVAAVAAPDFEETLGVNSRLQLAQAETILRRKKLDSLMESGVTIMDPASVFIDAAVEIGADSVIYPFTWIEGDTVIGSGCKIGPNTRIQNSSIGDQVTLQFAYAHDCRIANHVTAGPYVHIRPDTVLADGVKIGNFVEVKNSHVGEGSKIPHLSYIGDTDMGSGINIGCGVVTVNYDGKKKYRTTIENDAFIGCNANLVAPVTVRQGAYVAAGSTITKEVPAASLGVARARQTNIEGWVKK